MEHSAARISGIPGGKDKSIGQKAVFWNWLVGELHSLSGKTSDPASVTSVFPPEHIRARSSGREGLPASCLQ